MTTLQEAKVNAVRNWLRNHVEPQRQHDGMSSWAMAVSIVELIDEQDIIQQELDIIRMAETHVGESYAS